MTIIDRYLLRQFVVVFLICFVSLAGLYTVIDAFGRLDDFSGEGQSLAQSLESAGRYYLLQSVGFFNKTSGVLALISAMFTITWIQRHQEMTALLAAGLPRIRVLRPVLVAAVLIALAAAGLRELVIPNLRGDLARDSKNLTGEEPSELTPRYDNVSDLLLGGKHALLQSKTIVQPKFDLPPQFTATFGGLIVGEQAVYHEAKGPRPTGYLVKGVSQPVNIDTRTSLFLGEGKPLVVTRKDASWLQPGEAYVVSGVPFDLLAPDAQWRELASTAELIRVHNDPSTELGADVSVAVHARLTQPLLDATLLLIGLPLIVSRGARSPYLSIGLSILVVAGFFLVTVGGQSLGIGGWISPALAAWLPLFVFAPIAAAQSASLNQ